MAIDLEALSLAEILRLQYQLSEMLQRRFGRQLAVVFSDIVESTQFFKRYGDEEGRKQQQLHYDLLIECGTPVGGRVIDNPGDGALLCFPTVDSAIEGLIAFHNRVSIANALRIHTHQLRVRQGLHWGPTITDGVSSVRGDTVNLASRLAASCSPGQIRLTADAYRQVATPRHRLACASLPRTEFKGVAAPVEIFALEWRDRNTFPSHVAVSETGEVFELPDQDNISFGRLISSEGVHGNDIVLQLPNHELSQQISRWQFELRRSPDGYYLVSISNQATEVDGTLLQHSEKAQIRPGSVVRVAHVLTLTFVNRTVSVDANATKHV